MSTERHDNNRPSVSEASSQSPTRGKPRRKRRAVRRLLVALILLVAVLLAAVLLAPAALSTRLGSNFLLSLLNARIHGLVSVDKLTLAWFSPCRIDGLSVTDTDDRQVLHLASASVPNGLWHTLISRSLPERIDVDAPRTVLHESEDGRLSLAQALAPKNPSPRESAAPQTLPDLEINANNGAVKLVRADGAEFEIPDLDLQLSLRAPSAAKASLKLTLGDGGGLSADAEFGKLLADGRFQLEQLEGRLNLRTEQPVDLAAVTALAAPDSAIRGKASLQLEAAAQAGKLSAGLTADLLGLATESTDEFAVHPTDLRVAASINGDQNGAAGQISVAGNAGQAAADFSIPLAAEAFPPLDELVAEVLGEQPIELPDLRVDAHGRIDLAALAQAVPGLLRIKSGTQVTAGTLDVRGLALHGGPAPSLTADATLTDLAAATERGPLRWDPVTLAVDIASPAGKPAEIRKAELRSDAANITVAGGLSHLQGAFEGDLGKLHDRAGQIVELDLDDLGGNLRADFNMNRESDDRINVGVHLTGDGVRYRRGERTLNLARLEASQTGSVTLADRRPVRLDVERGSVDLDGQIVAAADGWYDLAAGRFQADVNLSRADLARVKELAAGIGVTIDELQGLLHGEFQVRRQDDDRIDLAANATVENLRYKQGDKSLNLARLVAVHDGSLSLTDGRPARLTTERTTIELDDGVTAEAVGWFDFGAQTFGADVKLTDGDVARLRRLAEGMGLDLGTLESGHVQLTARLDRESADADIRSTGDLLARDVQMEGGQALPQLAARWSGAAFEPAARRLAVESAQLDSDIAAVALNKVDCAFTDVPRLAGNVEGRADLARCLDLAAGLTKRADLPGVSGALRFRAAGRTGDAGVTLSGDAAIEKLELRTTDGKLVRDNLQLAYDASIDRGGETVELRRFNLVSDTLAADLTGAVRDLKSARSLALEGTYRLDWDRLTNWLHEWVPATAETVAVSGTSSATIRASGPWNRPDVRPSFRDADAGTQLHWDSARLYGVALDGLTLAPRLDEGRLVVPAVSVPAAGGQVNFGADVDFAPSPPLLRIPPALAVLRDIQVTPELGEHLLSRFNPIFSRATRMEGKADLVLQSLELPLGEAIKTAGRGSGRLELTEFRVQPSDLFATLLELGGLGARDMYAIRVSGLDFRIVDGRIAYQDLTFTFPDNKFDMKFRGSVGFDDTVDLIVSLPVGEQLLRRLNVVGPTAEYVRLLAGVRVDIPIKGTRESPRLDFSGVDVQSLLKDVLKKQIFDPGRILNPQPAPDKPAEQPRDPLQDLLEQLRRKREQGKDDTR